MPAPGQRAGSRCKDQSCLWRMTLWCVNCDVCMLCDVCKASSRFFNKTEKIQKIIYAISVFTFSALFQPRIRKKDRKLHHLQKHMLPENLGLHVAGSGNVVQLICSMANRGGNHTFFIVIHKFLSVQKFFYIGVML